MVDTPIGTNSPNYTLVSGDVGATIFCRVTATNASGSAQAFSNAVGPVAAAGGGDVTAPTITSSASVSNVENTALAHTLTANETVTWSKIGGADAAKFTLTGAVLSWTSSTKDFEAPDDADANNAYIVIVRATDTASNTTDQTITVTVTNVTESGFTPADLPSLLAWYKADTGVYSDAGTTVAAEGAAVNQWNDQSGHAYHLRQATDANGPIYSATGFNGTHGLMMAAAKVMATTAATVALTSASVLSAFVVCGQDDGILGGARLLVYLGTGGTEATDYEHTGSAVFLYSGTPGSSGSYQGGNAGPVISTLQVNDFRIGTIFNGTNLEMYRNNVASGLPTAMAPTFTGPGTICLSFSTNPWVGPVAEIVICNAALDSTQRTQLDDYFKTKWGLSDAEFRPGPREELTDA